MVESNPDFAVVSMQTLYNYLIANAHLDNCCILSHFTVRDYLTHFGYFNFTSLESLITLQKIDDVTLILLIRSIDLCTIFPWWQPESIRGHVTLMWPVAPFKVAWWCLNVAMQYFEETLLHIKNKKWKQLRKHLVMC